MGEMLRRIVWFALVACACAYAIYLVAGSFVESNASHRVPLVIHDSLAPGVHTLEGTITLSRSCDNVTVSTSQIASSSYALVFETWQSGSDTCTTEPTARDFQAIVLAPATGTRFYATLDGALLPIQVVSTNASTQ